MKKRVISPILICWVVFVFSSCGDDSKISMQTDNLDTTDYPVVTCSDFVSPTLTTTDTLPLLVVRIQFAGDPYDGSFSGNPFEYNNFYSDACTWAKKIFYSNDEGQLNNYFKTVSYNQFSLEPAAETQQNNDDISDGIITVTLSGNHPNPQSSGYFQQKLVDALSQADAYIDFSAYDTDADGIIERDELQVMFLVAGYESATTSNSAYPGVWAHKWCLYGQEGVATPDLDGVSLLSCDGNGYSRFGERHTELGYDATIGVMAHELGHAIWLLPDLYDTDSSSAGIGAFGLMGYGSWGQEANEKGGETPVHPSAWSKLYIGWVTATTPADASNNTLYSTADSVNFNIYKINITGTNEYFLLENRATTSYDKGLWMTNDYANGVYYGGGVAIWHIDEDQSGNANESRKLVDLEEANDSGLDAKSHYGRPTNLYYSSNNATFDNSSSPASKTNDGSNTSISITTISAQGATMTAYIDYP